MNITRQYVNGKWEPPFTKEEESARVRGFVAMCEARQAPATLGSERAFLADVGFRHHGLQDHPLWQQESIIAEAKAAGINIEGKRYFGGIADGRGICDPEAWCASQQDYIDVVKRRNLTVKSGSGLGGVNHEGVVAPPPPDIPLAADIVDRLAGEYVERDPDNWARKPKQEVREMVVDKHALRHRTPEPWKAEPNFKDIGDS